MNASYQFYRHPLIAIILASCLFGLAFFIQFHTFIDKEVAYAIWIIGFFVGFWYGFTPYVVIKEAEIRINKSPLHIVILPTQQVSKVEIESNKIVIHDSKKHFFNISLPLVFNQKEKLKSVLEEIAQKP